MIESKQELQPDIKNWDRIAYVISVVVILLVVMMRSFKIDVGVDFSFLPPIHAMLNSITAVLLICAFIQIKRKKIIAHKRLMITALLCSLLFLLSYVIYHFTTSETTFCGEGIIRTFYFFILISHVFLAGAILPFIFLTFIRGYFMIIAKHKAFARWVYPVWLYVAVSGPIVYLLLKPCYG